MFTTKHTTKEAESEATGDGDPSSRAGEDGGVTDLSIDRLVETSVVTDGARELTKHRIAQFDYHHVPQGPFGGDEKDDQFEVYYVPENECFHCGRASTGGYLRLGLIGTRRLYAEWAYYLSMTWDKEALTGHVGLDKEARDEMRKEGRDLSMVIASRMLAPKVRKVHAVARAEVLQIQRKAFATLGRVPKWALTPERIADRAREFGWPDPEYATRDFQRLRWFRLALSSRVRSEQDTYQKLRQTSGRVRKALAQMPRGISGDTLRRAIPHLDYTSKPPSRRLTWIVLSLSNDPDDKYALLAEAIQRASDYELRKTLKRARVLRAAQSLDRSEESFYIYAEARAYEMVHWISDVNDAEDTSLHCTGQTNLENWVERSARFHREMAQQRREARSRQVLRNSPFRTGYRPQDLPEGAEALVTPAAVRREGLEMDHCVGSSASAVARGKKMILHYEAEQSGATIELRPNGDGWTVGQVQGPNNNWTPACEKGRSAIRSWLESNPEIRPPQMDIGEAQVPDDNQHLRMMLAREQGTLQETEEKTGGASEDSPGGWERWRGAHDAEGEEREEEPDLPF